MIKRWMILASCLMSAAFVHGASFAVEVEAGTRHSSTGAEIAYSLFIPHEAIGLPRPPWPVVLLNHGFARSKEAHVDNARYMAKRGFIVLTPDQIGLGGIGSREKNITVMLEHLAWLQRRGRTPGDRLDGLVDPHRMALAGHSAGGALSFEAAVRSQSTDVPVAAIFLLDAVPWGSTLESAAALRAIAFGSLRSEPSPCNAQGSVRDLLADLEFAVEDVLVVGATHCDPENPTDLLCRLVCGGSRIVPRFIYFRLLVSFFQEALNVPAVEEVPLPYGPTLKWLEDNGLVARETVD